MKILAFGEIMMRLMPSDYKLISQVNELECLFTGTGANVLSGLYQMGNEVFMATRLPKNNVGYAAAAQLRKLGINDKYVNYGENHMGIYFLEVGIGSRPSEVTYMNRRESSFGKSTINDYNIEEMLQGIDCIHLCGISLAISKELRECLFKLANKAKEKGITVIFDCNFRPSLWNSEERKNAKDIYRKMLDLSDIVFAGEKDALLILEIDKNEELTGIKQLEYLLEIMRREHNIKKILGTIRTNEGCIQKLKGYMLDKDGLVLSKDYELTIYDRIGAGDAFTAGAIHGLFNNTTRNEVVDFATCSGVLAHTTYGDAPLLGVKNIERLMKNSYTDLIR